MTFPYSIFEWLSRTAISQTFNEAHYLWFAGFMAVHLLGIALLLGTSLLIDLRVINLGIRAASIERVAEVLRPWFLAGLIVAVLAGTWLFVADPLKYYVNPAFRLKALLLLMAVIAQLVVQYKPLKSVTIVAGLLWIGTTICGRVVGLL